MRVHSKCHVLNLVNVSAVSSLRKPPTSDPFHDSIFYRQVRSTRRHNSGQTQLKSRITSHLEWCLFDKLPHLHLYQLTSLLSSIQFLELRISITVPSIAQDHEVENRGIGQPADRSALPTGDSYTSQPERDLYPGDPNLVGGAPPEEKKGMTEKVKGLFGGMKKGHDEEVPDSAIGSGVGHTPDSSPYGTNITDADQTGHQSLDPTGPATADGADFREDIASDERPELEGATNQQGGAALTDEAGNLKPGPHQNAIKREGIFSKIKDKLHGSK